MLDDGAVDNVLVRGLCGFGALRLYCCGAYEGLEDVLLIDLLASSSLRRRVVMSGSNKNRSELRQALRVCIQIAGS